MVIRYFHSEKGVQIKLLDLNKIKGETLDIISENLMRVINGNNIKPKIIAVSGDNTN